MRRRFAASSNFCCVSDDISMGGMSEVFSRKYLRRRFSQMRVHAAFRRASMRSRLATSMPRMSDAQLHLAGDDVERVGWFVTTPTVATD